ncbi:MAG: tRNA guanosine(34) transglycosylase Tgt [Acidimicrobiia bacterium]|nr:tRNA guanosine(34) transglycosylase Tgt [Acidimicrobiia bacterium]
MTHAAEWTSITTDGKARSGILRLTHGEVPTPAFIAVGTRAAVRAVDTDDLTAVGSDMILANTYHLMLRPGSDVVAKVGSLHTFWGWDGPILTDSGGYQVYSLDPEITERGARFRSIYDGSYVDLGPEESMRVQQDLGADIAMAFDHLVGLPAPTDVVREAMERTLRWEERALAVHERTDQALFGIVQGGVDRDLRAESARRTAELGFPGFAIGGLSVGESPSEMTKALDAAAPELPDGKVRYVMGLGDAEGVLAAIASGYDIFDCVWPTRLARHGKVFTPNGDYNLKRAEFTTDTRPLQPGCGCPVCQRHHRAYLRHLVRTGELGAMRLLSIHNLWYTLRLMEDARTAIGEGRFGDFRKGVLRRRTGRHGLTELEGPSPRL